MMWSLQNFAQDMIDSCAVIMYGKVWGDVMGEMELQENEISIEIELWWKNH